MVIMEDECSSASDSADSSPLVVASTPHSAVSTPTGSPSSSPKSPPSTSTCNSDASSSAGSAGVGGIEGGGGYGICLRSRTRRPVTPPSSQNAKMVSEKLIKSPPTPHKIQSLDEKSLRLDENCLTISPSARNGFAHNNHITANNTKPLNSTHQNKTVKLVDSESGKKEKPSIELCPVRRRKISDYFVQRRSNRKTQEAINAEKHQMLVEAISEGKQDGLMAKKISGKGRGVVATKPFLRHEFVIEYAGKLLTNGEARTREDKYAEDSAAGCYMYYFQYNNQQYCVDATKETDRLGRLINHSRNGNLVTKVVEVKGTPRLILIAKRDIDINEELSYDYGDRSREALRHHPWLAN